MQKIVNTKSNQLRSKCPARKSKGYRDQEIDVLSLYRAPKPVAASNRRLDPDQRALYVKLMKQKLGIDS